MPDPIAFYKQEQEHYKLQENQLKLLSNRLSIARLLLFLCIAVVVYYFHAHSWLMWLLTLGGVGLFIWLLNWHTNVRSQRQLAQRLIGINTEELSIAKGHYHERLTGEEFSSSQHSFAKDIDLFGKGSFFQYLNRTGLKEGTAALAALLNANDISRIPEKQEAIKELAKDPKWLQRYTALAQGLHTDVSISAIEQWLNAYKSFLTLKHWFFGIAFSITSVTLLILTAFEGLPMSVIGYWLLLGLGITSLFLKRVNTLAGKASKAKEVFKPYTLLLKEIESRSFKAQLLIELQQQIQSHDEKASAVFFKFSKALDALDHRHNLIAAVLGNGLFLYDILQSYRVEQWISSYGDKAEDWFKVVAQFDAFNSLASFAFNHPDFVYPELSEDKQLIKASSLGHPLIAQGKRVCSDLEIETDGFFIVTGANMAGKSTFLRALALHIVMANMGLPVCARESTYKPIKLISSMRTSDSLAEESSYFFSELTRLKFIVEALHNDQYFVILDEILKGTNSTDKAKGSRQFVERLVDLNACGIIATHDLSLTAISDDDARIKNYFFDAEIKNDELYFDYRLKPGVCQNMNASFLLRKMGIVQ